MDHRKRLGIALLPLLVACTAEVQDGIPSERLTAKAQDALSGQSWKLWRPAAGTVNTNIPVCFEPNSGFTEAEKAAIKTRATAWTTAASRIVFTYWGTCTYQWGSALPMQLGIHVTKGSRCKVEEIGSDIAGVRNGVQLADTGEYCVVHEFGHALGFTHEQERTDNTLCNADRTQSEPDLGMTDYDHDSVMNYCGPDNGVLTALDVLGARSVYGHFSQTLPYSNFGDTRYALRASTGHFVQADNDPHDIRAEQLHIKGHEKFWIDRVTGSGTNLRFGDQVSFMTHDFYRIRALGSNRDWAVDKSTFMGELETWTIVNANNPASTALVRVNDEVAFRSFYGRYLYRGTDENVRAHNTAIQSREKWRLLWLPFMGSEI